MRTVERRADQGRGSLRVLPEQAQEEEVGDGRGSADVPRVAQLVAKRRIDPRVVEVVPRGPDDGRDPGLLQVQLGQLLGLVADGDLAGRRRLDPGTLDERVDDSAEALVEEAVGPLEASGQVAGEGDQLAVGAGQT